MKDKDIDEVFNGLLLKFPILTKKLLNISSVVTSNKEITRAHVSLMRFLKIEELCKMSDLAKILYVSKPTVTILVEKLVEFNMVKRKLDEKDRRVIYIELTDTGCNFLQERTEAMKVAFCKSTQKFNTNDLILLKETLNNMEMLVGKMDE
ncbi:MarR family transcriptional regulator [Clostridium estertheticum]|uniref:MarR family transcriptional regulator n=1 Tax=Clostridium estertheticum TaxID=238834 RepID=A0AA47EF80_9CLOT|nr:MarR family transcriptional regulator [Clostridium estertheticum]MBU3156523.1 MarR family transcriptional regulator [Clostridium estertheticum]MBU3199928.1 MarR family transcriptional regulator [Clostridium estertheticum]WAG58980.1 MarR family transcriptional regulator [Clostridium estertheticum]WAG66974.1 MarR family transcriptional regulator [Clostridium estertheticum]